MKKLLIGSILCVSLLATEGIAQTLAPDGSYVGGKPGLAPDGTFTGGSSQLAPDGSYVGGKPELAPNGSYTGE